MLQNNASLTVYVLSPTYAFFTQKKTLHQGFKPDTAFLNSSGEEGSYYIPYIPAFMAVFTTLFP